MATYIDFEKIKQQADFGRVLTHYGFEVAGGRTQLKLPCPFHEDGKPSLSVNLARGIWHCFGCDASGGVLDFVCRKEGVSVRQAALRLAEICEIADCEGKRPPKGARKPAEGRSGVKTQGKGSAAPSSALHEAPVKPQGPAEALCPLAEGEARNEPLTPEFIERFEGKLVREHPYLAQRGLTPETGKAFRLGVYPAEGKGMMRNRLCIPIFDYRPEDGLSQLVAYAGRWTGPDETIPVGEGKYKLPKGFHKELVVFNLHRVAGRRHVVVVEGYFSIFRLHQLGVPAVALMGCSMSERQLQLLEASGARYLTVMLDGDEAGREAALPMMRLLAHSPLRTKFALLPQGNQPDTADERLLLELIRRPAAPVPS